MEEEDEGVDVKEEGEKEGTDCVAKTQQKAYCDICGK